MSDAKKIRDYQKSRQPKPEPSAAEHRANCENVVDLLMQVAAKIPNPHPVKESFSELFAGLRSSVLRKDFIVDAVGGRRLAVSDGIVTEFEYVPNLNSTTKIVPVAESEENVTSNILTADDYKILNSLK